MTFKLGMNVDLCVGYIIHVVVSMTLTLMQAHSGSAKNKLCFEVSHKIENGGDC